MKDKWRIEVLMGKDLVLMGGYRAYKHLNN